MRSGDNNLKDSIIREIYTAAAAASDAVQAAGASLILLAFVDVSYRDSRESIIVLLVSFKSGVEERGGWVFIIERFSGRSELPISEWNRRFGRDNLCSRK